ncbi:MAG: hypothetical protein ACT4OX_12820 [Actinomycetota bacterium]
MAAAVSITPFTTPLTTPLTTPRSSPASPPERDAGVRHPRPRAPRWHRAAAVYRRRRLAVAVLGVGVLLVAGRAGATLGGDSLAPAERRPHVATVVVEPGDSLWTVAERLAPDADPRRVVDALIDARDTSEVWPGETLTWLAP